MGENKGRDHPELSPDTKDYLRRIFRPMLSEFNTMTGVNIRLS